MANTKESGHRKNVAQFEGLVGFVKSLGTTYESGNSELELTNIEALLESSRTALNDWYSAESNYAITASEKQDLHRGVPKMITRIMNQIRASKVSKVILDDATLIARSFQPARPKQKELSAGAAMSTEHPVTTSTRSRGNTSYNKVMENVSRMIALVEDIPTYTPKNTELTLVGLQSWLDELKAAETKSMQAQIELNHARMERDRLLYSENGLVVNARKVKQQLRATFGYNSPVSKKVTPYRFIAFGKM